MIWYLVFLYWLFGAATWLWLLRDTPVTWGRLISTVVMGWLAPAAYVGLVSAFIYDAKFWSTPIFKRSPE